MRRIISPRVGTGTHLDPFRPSLADIHPVASWIDASGSDPAAVAGKVLIHAVVSAAVLAAIRADVRFSVVGGPIGGSVA